MNRPTCQSTALLANRPPTELSDAERLQVETHLSGCSACRSDAALLAALQGLAGEQDALSASRRDRVLEAVVIARSRPPARRARTAWVVGAGGAVAAMAAGLALFLRPTVLDVVPAPAETLTLVPPPSPAPDPTDRFAPTDVWWTVENDSAFRLPKARVHARSRTRVRWRPAANTLDLGEGVVRLQVESLGDDALRVSTEHFVAEVVGTEFTVDLGGVSVVSGRVRVLGSAHGRELALLSAGQQWKVPLVQSTAVPSAGRRPVAAPVPMAQGVTDADRIDTLLTEARRALGRGDATTAERKATEVGSLIASRGQQADARVLLAECALSRGEHALALRRYLATAARFPDLPAGEIALFTTAGLYREQGDEGHARSQLETYRARYPSGLFQRQVAEQLRR